MKKYESYLNGYLVCAIALVALTLCVTTAFGATICIPGYHHRTIQSGINVAVNGDIVLVADGTYTGDGNKNLDFGGKAITVKSYKGSSNCIIDCEGIGRGFYFDSNEGQNSVVSGITIRNADSDAIWCGGSSPTITDCIITDNDASGIFCGYDSSPTITNCIITYNRSDIGGGIHCWNSSPTIANCLISRNETVYTAGVIHCAGNSSSTITNCTITDNIGLGIGTYDSSTVVTNCTIKGNSGRGIYCSASSLTVSGCVINNSGGGGIDCSDDSSGTITNCLIAGNTSPEWGGGIICHTSSPTITNCTITGNTAQWGGGIHCYDSAPMITNCIIWGNSPDEIDGSGLIVTYSDIYGGHSGDGNMNLDPLFVDPEDEDFHLQSDSPCIDAGTNDALGLPDTDIAGHRRIIDGDNDDIETVDMGAYEFFLGISGCINFQGSPLEGSEVILSQWPEPWRTTWTDEKGCYEFESMDTDKEFYIIIRKRTHWTCE